MAACPFICSHIHTIKLIQAFRHEPLPSQKGSLCHKVQGAVMEKEGIASTAWGGDL